MCNLSNIKLLKIVGEVKKENPISKYCFLLENFPIKWSPFTEHWKWYFCSSPRKGYIVLFTWTSHKRRKWINSNLQVFIFPSWECFHVCLTTLFIWHQLRGLCVALCRNGFHYPPQPAFTSPQLPTIVADMECIICTLRLQNTFLQRPCYKRMYNYNRWRWIKWIDGEYTWLLLIRELK